jgi:hypothetical protein
MPVLLWIIYPFVLWSAWTGGVDAPEIADPIEQ